MKKYCWLNNVFLEQSEDKKEFNYKIGFLFRCARHGMSSVGDKLTTGIYQ